MTKKSREMDIELLRSLIRYEPETGELFWLPRPVEMFPCKCAHHRWTKRFVGKKAFSAKMANGYLLGRIFGKGFLAHRVVWALVHGEWPKGHIDHIDGNPKNNCINNLRDVPEHLNHRNNARKRDTKAPCNGVQYMPRRKKWRARIHYDGLTRHVGVFETLEEAIAARKDAEAANGFHPNHGRANRRAA